MIAHSMDNNQNMENDNQDQTIKHSDFSIDHILNRAGNSFVNSGERTVDGDRIDNNVKFQWLQCSRYCPPRVPRIHKKDIQKRQLGRHPRIPFTSYQLSILEQKFRESPYLSSEEVIVTSKKLQLADIRVKIWFQNRRARERREKNGGIGDNKIKEDRNATDHCVDNRLFSASNLNINDTRISHSTSEESQNQNLLVTNIKSETNSPPLDCSTNSGLSVSRKISEVFENGCVPSQYFLAGGLPFFVPNVNFVHNKDVGP